MTGALIVNARPPASLTTPSKRTVRSRSWCAPGALLKRMKSSGQRQNASPSMLHSVTPSSNGAMCTTARSSPVRGRDVGVDTVRAVPPLGGRPVHVADGVHGADVDRVPEPAHRLPRRARPPLVVGAVPAPAFVAHTLLVRGELEHRALPLGVGDRPGLDAGLRLAAVEREHPARRFGLHAAGLVDRPHLEYVRPVRHATEREPAGERRLPPAELGAVRPVPAVQAAVEERRLVRREGDLGLLRGRVGQFGDARVRWRGLGPPARRGRSHQLDPPRPARRNGPSRCARDR